MKLRYKKTGEVKELYNGKLNLNFGDCNRVYNSLSELNEEWEDVEEPVKNRYYLRNKETGYVMSFKTREEQMWLYNVLDDWEKVYITTELCGEEE